MAVGNDAVIGRTCLFFGITFMVYYTIWTIGLPLFESSLSIHSYFPDNISYAVGIPLSFLTVFVSFLFLYSNYLMKFD